MLLGHRRDHFRMRIHQRHDGAAVAGEDRAVLDGRARHRPFAVRHLECQVDDSEMAAPEAGHDRGHAVQGAGRHVDAFQPAEFLGREDTVSVAEQDGVDAVDLAQEEAGILLHAAAAGGWHRARNAGSPRRCPHPSAFIWRHVMLGGLDDVLGDQPSLQMGPVPDHDLRRCEADDADLDGMLGPIGVGDRAGRE